MDDSSNDESNRATGKAAWDWDWTEGALGKLLDLQDSHFGPLFDSSSCCSHCGDITRPLHVSGPSAP